MFLLLPSNSTPLPKKLIREAVPRKEAMQPDICILNPTNVYSAILLNSIMLREALLANPAITKELLGVIVQDALVVKETKKPIVKKPKQTKQVKLKNIDELAEEIKKEVHGNE
jgi:hypothetical protein